MAAHIFPVQFDISVRRTTRCSMGYSGHGQQQLMSTQICRSPQHCLCVETTGACQGREWANDLCQTLGSAYSATGATSQVAALLFESGKAWPGNGEAHRAALCI